MESEKTRRKVEFLKKSTANAKQMYTKNHVNDRKTLLNMKETEICLLYMKDDS